MCAQQGNTGCWVFKRGGHKIGKSFAYQHAERKLLNFENWCNVEVSKIGHHFRKYSDLKIDLINESQKTKQKNAPKLIFFNGKKWERFR